MVNLVTTPFEDDELRRQTSLFRLRESTGAAAGESFERGFEESPGPSLARLGTLNRAQDTGGPSRAERFRQAFPNAKVPQRLLDEEETSPALERRQSEDEWKASENYRPGLTYPDGGYTEEAAALIAERFDRRTRRAIVMNRAPQGGLATAAVFGAEMAGALVDPLSIASSFVPVVGEVRYAAMVNRFGRTGARALRGGVEGFVGNAAIEPASYLAAQAEQNPDYTMANSLINVAFGTVFSAGLHVGVGAVGDAVSRFQRPTVEVAHQKAVADLVEGRSVDVAPVVRRDPLFAFREGLLSGTTLGRSGQSDVRPDIRGLPTAAASPAERAADSGIVLQATPESGRVRVFNNRKDAERAVRRVAKRGEELQVEQRNADEFVLTRRAELDFSRGSDGTITTFKTERAARRVIEQTRMQGATVVPHGPAGPDRRFAILRNASERDVRDVLADPGRLTEPGRPEPAPDAGAVEPSQAVRDFVSRLIRNEDGGFTREDSSVLRFDAPADEDAARAAAITEAGKRLVSDDLPDAEVDADIDALRAAGRLTAEDDALLSAADATIGEAESRNRAFRAAAMCMTRTA